MISQQQCKPKTFYRIQIYSSTIESTPPPGGFLAGATAPDWRDGFYYIDVPNFLDSTRYQFAVESFNINRSGANVGNGYVVHASITQPNSYNTLSHTTSDAILTYNGPAFYRFIDFSSIGIPCTDLSFMRSKFLRIYLTTLDGLAITDPAYFGAGLQWAMSLMVFPIERDD